MAILWIDGHTSYLAGSAPSTAYGGSGSPAVVDAAGPNGERAISLPGRSYLSRGVSIPAGATFTVGRQVGFAALPSANVEILAVNGGSGSTIHLTLSVTPTGGLILYRSFSTSIATAPAGTVTAGTFATVEMQAVVDDAAGSVAVKVNGVAVITYAGDTRNGGATAVVDLIQFGSRFGSSSASDVSICAYPYITDTTGTVHTGFLGTLRGARLAFVGAGTYAEGSVIGGAAGWSAVDEIPVGTGDGISFSAAGQRFTFATEDVTAPDIVAASVIFHGAGVYTAAGLALRGGSTAPGAMQTLSSGSGRHFASVVETDPSTGLGWTAAGVSVAQWGLICGSSGGGADPAIYQAAVEVFSTGAITVLADGMGGGTPATPRVIAPVWIGL